MSAITVPRLSPEEYLAIDRAAEVRSEYYNGQMFAMSGASRAHSRLSVNTTVAMDAALTGSSCELFSNELRIRVSSTGLYTYPDLTVVCSEPVFADGQFDTLLNPSILVEILSPSTEAHDRGFKFIHYGKLESLQEYMLISQTEPRVEIFRRRSPGEWALSESTGLETTCHLQSIDVRLALADLYRRVAFPALS